jgi:TolB protein
MPGKFPQFPPSLRLRRLRLFAGQLAWLPVWLMAALMAAVGPVAAQMRIEITGVGSQQFPVAVANFQQEGSIPQDVAGIIRANLARAGVFKLIDAGAAPISETTPVVLPEWRTRGADALVAGSVSRLADGRYDLRFRLYDSVKGSQLDALSYISTAPDLRLNAHRISDRIYEKLTGERGVFATRIAYIVQLGKGNYELQVADSDGGNAQTALRSREPIISPTWSADGQRLAYVSFEAQKPVVYVHLLTNGERRPVANFRGSNSAPAFSPDGRTLAVVLTKDGNSEIYLIDVDGTNPRRVTNNPAIDTEPTFTADGSTLYFTSDRGGGPQIYRMPANGGDAQRVTFNGDYNISPRLSPDGKLLSYVSRRGGNFQVQVLDLASGTELAVTDTVKDESPSFAPNGRQLLYATEVGGRGILASATVDGRIRTRLSGPTGDVREPAWGPFIK